MKSDFKDLIDRMDQQCLRCSVAKHHAQHAKALWWSKFQQDLIKPSSLVASFGVGFIAKTPMTAETAQSKGSVLSGVFKTVLITGARGHILKMMGQD